MKQNNRLVNKSNQFKVNLKILNNNKIKLKAKRKIYQKKRRLLVNSKKKRRIY